MQFCTLLEQLNSKEIIKWFIRALSVDINQFDFHKAFDMCILLKQRIQIQKNSKEFKDFKQDFTVKYPRKKEIPFNYETKSMSVVCEVDIINYLSYGDNLFNQKI